MGRNLLLNTTDRGHFAPAGCSLAGRLPHFGAAHNRGRIVDGTEMRSAARQTETGTRGKGNQLDEDDF
jgi:hypothetical protein